MNEDNKTQVVVHGSMKIDLDSMQEIKSIVREEIINEISEEGLCSEEVRKILVDGVYTNHAIWIILCDIIPSIIDKLDKQYEKEESHFLSDQKLHTGLNAINNILDLIKKS